jgi:hypothetical protein
MDASQKQYQAKKKKNQVREEHMKYESIYMKRS